MDQLPPFPAPASWIEALDRSAAEIATGQTVPLAPILEELHVSADRLEARLRSRDGQTASTGAARRG